MAANIYAPSASATVQGKKFPVDSVTINITMNSIPTATFNCHAGVVPTANTTIIPATPSYTSQLVGDMQTAMYKPRLVTDTTIILRDGSSNQPLTFNGYLTMPSFSVGVGMSGHRFSAVHQSAALSAFDPSIYLSDAAGLIDLTSDPSNLTSSSIADRMNSIIGLMYTSWQNYRESWFQENTQSVNQAVARAEVNNVTGSPSMWDMWKNILTESSESMRFKSLDKLGITADCINVRILDVIQGLYLQKTDDFWNTIKQFMQHFQLIFIPVLSSDRTKSGIFARLSDISESVTSNTLIVAPKDISYNLGSSSTMPVTGIIISGFAMRRKGDVSTNRADANSDAPVPQELMMAAWPETQARGGRIVQVGPPPWLVTGTDGTLLTQVAGLTRYWPAKGTPVPLTTDAYVNSVVKMGDIADTYRGTALQPILQEWAHNIYVPAAIGSASATVTIPLDVSQKPGTRVQVATIVGGAVVPQFVGILSSVTHQVNVHTRSHGMAQTTLQFTCVQAGSFALESITNFNNQVSGGGDLPAGTNISSSASDPVA